MATSAPAVEDRVVKSFYIIYNGGTWTFNLVVPVPTSVTFKKEIPNGSLITLKTETVDGQAALVRGAIHFSDPPGLPTQDSKAPLAIDLIHSSLGKVHQPVVAAYIVKPKELTPPLTDKTFDSKILSEKGKHALSTKTFGGDKNPQWSLAVLDALETEGAVAAGETKAFVTWLRAKSAELALTPGLDDFVKTLANK